MIFDGIDPWVVNDPFVEIRTNGELIDLHNWATFVGFSYRLPGRLSVEFEYDETQGRQEPARIASVQLVFQEVEELTLRQIDVEERYEPSTLSDIVYRPIASGTGEVAITFMDGTQLHFLARAVSVARGDG